MTNATKALLVIVIIVLAVIPASLKLMQQKAAPSTPSTSAPAPPGTAPVPPAVNPAAASYIRDTAPAFVDDPDVLGNWTSVDFVSDIANFDPARQSWTGDLYLKSMRFFANGTTGGPWQWSKGTLWHPGDRSLGKYEIKEIGGAKYLFMEWISGDVTIRGQKPKYYVLKKEL